MDLPNCQGRNEFLNTEVLGSIKINGMIILFRGSNINDIFYQLSQFLCSGGKKHLIILDLKILLKY